MKLYEVPRGSKITCEKPDGPPGTNYSGPLEVTFHKLDGAYSYCTTDKGEVVHLHAWEDVEIAE